MVHKHEYCTTLQISTALLFTTQCTHASKAKKANEVKWSPHYSIVERYETPRGARAEGRTCPHVTPRLSNPHSLWMPDQFTEPADQSYSSWCTPRFSFLVYVFVWIELRWSMFLTCNGYHSGSLKKELKKEMYPVRGWVKS